MKTALITGITGQDGSYLAELLLSKGYRVVGFARRASWLRPHCASHLEGQIELVFGDMAEGLDVAAAIRAVQPDEIYNLASQSRPGESWSRAPETLLINGMGAIRLFESVRQLRPACRVYHASSSEMFGRVTTAPQNEETLFSPVNPYAAAKVYAHQMASIYRESYNLFIACGVLFNHESARRPLHFLTQKVAYGAACAALGIAHSVDVNEMGKPIVDGGKLALGNLDIARDWGFAGDFVRAMWLMLQQEMPGDFVIGTGQTHTLQQLCDIAYSSVGCQWRDHVVSDPALVRPLEPGRVVADAARARAALGWVPETGFVDMVRSMVAAQLQRLKQA